MKGEIVLNVEKEIRGEKIKAGTVLGRVESEKNFTVEDMDIGMQLGEVRILPVAEKKEVIKK